MNYELDNEFSKYDVDETIKIYGCYDHDHYTKDDEMPLDWHLAN